MYDKVVLPPIDISNLYNEPISIDDAGNRVRLERHRKFQEYLGAIDFDEGRAISKGNMISIIINLPRHLPNRKPYKNWFQIALSAEENPLLADPLGCAARYKGVLPGVLNMPRLLPAEFVLEDNPRCMPANYALFIYDSADYSSFLEGVTRLIGGYINRGRTVVSDQFGNKILVSTNDSSQPMLLIPVSLLIGGKEHVCKTWENILMREARPMKV